MKPVRLSVFSGMLDIKLKSRVQKFKFVAQEKLYKVIDFTLKCITSMGSRLKTFFEAFK